jgi:hypothetical protein
LTNDIFLDNPIVLDDDQPVDTHKAAAPNDGKPTFEVADPVNPSGPSPTLSEVLAEPGADDGKNAPDGLAQYNRHNRAGDEGERGNNLHEDEALHTNTLARGDCGNEYNGNGTGSDAPASVGLIHDVFAEYEETFVMPRRKQKAARSALHDCPDSDTTAGSIPCSDSQGEPWGATDDGIADMEQPIEAAGGDAGRCDFSKKRDQEWVYFSIETGEQSTRDRDSGCQVPMCFNIRWRLPHR